MQCSPSASNDGGKSLGRDHNGGHSEIIKLLDLECPTVWILLPRPRLTGLVLELHREDDNPGTRETRVRTGRDFATARTPASHLVNSKA